ncbi:hypothetical protein H3146_07450 [Streptomyces sp. OF3]|uniref:HNH endonuclease n=1 Tax=Streptomyces alkaliterrae TaxID=2213162 RepID=A0A7W3WJ84_9ACTN|nr:hypothetical protein [Streptomyces alkaliterrae]MBB1253205.1 hypothetical protein [Streptomyces alkaliterrae]
MKLRGATCVLAGGAILASIFITPGNATAHSSINEQQPSPDYITGRDEDGHSWTLSTAPLDEEQLKKITASDADFAHRLPTFVPSTNNLPPAGWRACAWNAKPDKVVHDYLRIRVRYGGYIKGDTAYLECGNKDFGYKHTLNRHQKDWSAESAYIKRNWRDLAAWSITHILKDPDKVVFKSKKKTWCWSRAIFLYRGNEKIKTIYPKVGLGTTGKRILTAFPSRSQCSGKKVYPK